MGKQLDRGIAFYRERRFAEAARVLEGALRRDRGDGQAAYLLGVARLAINDDAGAHQALTRAAALAPTHAETFRALAEANDRLGRGDETITALRRAAALDPRNADVHLALGAALLAAGHAAPSLAASETAIELEPNLATALNNAGLALKAMGDRAAARRRFEQALDADPALALAAFNLGKMLFEQPDVVAAEPFLRRAIALAPQFAEARLTLADLLRETARTDAALAELDAILDFAPNHPVATVWRTIFELPVLYADPREVSLRRARYAQRLETLSCGVATSPEHFLPGFATTRPFFLAYQGEDDRDLQQRYGACLSAVVASRVGPIPLTHSRREKTRVGIVSGFFRRHSVWKIPTRGWLEGLDRERFELVGYHTGALIDECTQHARSLCDTFVEEPMGLVAWAARLAADACDVLLYPEIGMDPMALQLAALRLAPLQINGLGHPTPSGLATIDIALSSALMEPEDGDAHYGERLVRLPNLGVRYDPLVAAPMTPNDAPHDRFTFWCPQSLFKYLPQYDEVFARIAAAVPHVCFDFIRYQTSEAVTDVFARRLAVVFERYGLSRDDHCRFLPRLYHEAFVLAASQCDAMLDGLGWSGFNSTLESLVCDLPLVGFEGQYMRGRHSAAILAMLGLPDMVARTPDAFVTLAVRLATDTEFHTDIRRRIGAARHRLYRDDAPIAALAALIEDELGAARSDAGATSPV